MSKPAIKIQAEAVARYYYARKNIIGLPPTPRDVARKFGRSTPWATKYVNLARAFGMIRDID